MKFPANLAILTEARMYAIESINHTYDYDGWQDGYAKAGRIVTGKYCQLWLGELCRLNGISHQKDRSSPYIHDNGDLLINGWNVDCKGSVNKDFVGQVSPHIEKDEDIDLYAFFLTDRNYSFIEPVGFATRDDILSKGAKVRNGETIPGTCTVQKFGDHSYFLSVNDMRDFFKTLNYLKNTKKQNF